MKMEKCPRLTELRTRLKSAMGKLRMVRPTAGQRVWNELLRDLAAYQAALEASDARYKSLFDNNHAVMLLIDPHSGMIVDANPAACSYYGWSHAELTQRPIAAINTLSPAEIKAKMGSACQLDQQHFFFRHRLASGAVRDVEVYSGPITVGGRELLYSIVHDVSERREAEAALEQARLRAEAASRSKGEFLANMSHEIRTPLNGLLGNLQLLQQTPLNAEQRELVGTALFSGTSLQAVVNDILDLSKLESGQVVLDDEPFDLAALLTDLLAVFRPQTVERGLEVTLDYPAGLARRFRGDVGRVRQILFNLLGNAVKFTAAGAVRVSVGGGTAVGHGSGRLLTLTIADTGIGIAPELLERIFEPFTQVDASYRRRHQGTGLGLSIARRLAEQLGGDIAIASVPGQGTTVTVRLLLAAAPEPPAVPVAGAVAPAVTPEHAPLTILVVEDNFVNLTLAKRILEQAGHRICCAASGHAALELLRQEAVELVFMDIQMPELDGFETLSLMRQEPALLPPQVPVVAMTAHALADDREKCLAAGFDGYLAKPFTLAELHAAVARHRPATSG